MRDQRPKYTEQWIQELKDAGDYLNSHDIEHAHRRTLARAVDDALADAIRSLERMETTARDGKPWSDEEVQIMVDFLKSKGDCHSFEDERAVLDTLSRRVRRSPLNIKRKASQLDLHRYVDYWFNHHNDRYGK